MARTGRVQTLVIGVGNPYRGDDGAGPAVAQRLGGQVPPEVQVLEATGEGAALLESWDGAARVILIDAVQAGPETIRPPGTILRFDAAAQSLPSDLFHYSTHAFSVAEAVELSRVLGTLPASCQIFGIVGATFSHGVGLSAPVAAAVEVVAAEIGRLLAR